MLRAMIYDACSSDAGKSSLQMANQKSLKIHMRSYGAIGLAEKAAELLDRFFKVLLFTISVSSSRVGPVPSKPTHTQLHTNTNIIGRAGGSLALSPPLSRASRIGITGIHISATQ